MRCFRAGAAPSGGVSAGGAVHARAGKAGSAGKNRCTRPPSNVQDLGGFLGETVRLMLLVAILATSGILVVCADARLRKFAFVSLFADDTLNLR